jgi:hypothetical protein
MADQEDRGLWAILGLATGAEIVGILPTLATGRIAEFMNSDAARVLEVRDAATEDVSSASDVPLLAVKRDHVTYLLLWSEKGVSIGDVTPGWSKAGTPNKLHVVLRTRVSIRGTAYFPSGVDLSSVLRHTDEPYFLMWDAELRTSTGQSRQSEILLVSREHVMFGRIA